MAASITTLRTRRDRLRAEQAAELRALVQAQPGLPQRAVAEIVTAIDRETASQAPGWSFVLVNPDMNAAIIRWLAAHSRRPLLAVQLWSEALRHLDWDTGEIRRTREQLAEAIGATPRDVSRVMTELEQEDIGAISRRREPVAGMKGRGVVRYFVSPRAATHLTGAARDAAQAQAPIIPLFPPAE
jgi:CRP-like cAMP-binding protein